MIKSSPNSQTVCDKLVVFSMSDEDPLKKIITFCLRHQSVIWESPRVENELKQTYPNPSTCFCILACFLTISLPYLYHICAVNLPSSYWRISVERRSSVHALRFYFKISHTHRTLSSDTDSARTPHYEFEDQRNLLRCAIFISNIKTRAKIVRC